MDASPNLPSVPDAPISPGQLRWRTIAVVLATAVGFGLGLFLWLTIAGDLLGLIDPNYQDPPGALFRPHELELTIAWGLFEIGGLIAGIVLLRRNRTVAVGLLLGMFLTTALCSGCYLTAYAMRDSLITTGG
jgi:hypothetical protein